jgi:para-nitrobenzyl esterase
MVHRIPRSVRLFAIVFLLFPSDQPLNLEAQSADDACAVSTPSGVVRGVLRGTGCTYLGIPYAAAPVGDLRWRPPQPKAPWAPAVLSATVAPPSCPLINPPTTGVPSGNEDCLMLNIWAPLRPARSPVIVWLHPGNFQAASANLAAANGERFAQERNAIVVAPNYRLGPFGFLAHSALTLEDPAYRSSGNYGLLDQRAALAWVRDHIAAFGGDPGNVTIAGASAGSQSVNFHLVSPASSGLFHKAIMQSGFVTARWTNAREAEAQGEQFARALQCTDARTGLACLRSKTRDQVLRALPLGQRQLLESEAVQWNPIVDGLEIPDQPRDLYRRGRFVRVPLIVGVNRDEGWTFVDQSFPGGLDAAQYETTVRNEFGADAPAVLGLYPASAFSSPKDALSQLIGDAEFACEARRVARLMSQARVDVYFYFFEHTVDAVTPGRAFHGLETNLVFGNNFAAPSNHVLTAEDLSVFRTISGYWGQFAGTGNPSSPGAARWPLFRVDRYPILSDRFVVLDNTVSDANRFRERQCNFWDRYYFRSVIGTVPASAR